MPKKRLQLGVVGCGAIAREIFAECKDLDVVRPAAAFDPDPANLDSFASTFGSEPETDFESLLARKDLDALALMGPPRVRPEQILQAAERGLAVFTEKPLALTVAEGLKVVAACRTAKVPLMVGHVLRYFGGFGVLAERVRSGELGKPLGIEIHRYGGPFPPALREAWRLRKADSGGPLFELHVHEFDFARYLLGDPVSIYARSRRVGVDSGTDYEDHMMGLLEFESGALGQCHFSMISARVKTGTCVTLEKGVVWGGFRGAREIASSGEARDLPLPGGEPAYRKEIRLFAESVLEGKPVPISGEDGLWAVAAAEAFGLSAATGEAVRVREVLGP